VVLWVVWVWKDIETRHAASEAGISKSTLTGVVSTLEARGLVRRRTHPSDGRRVLLSLTPKARTLMTELFPKLNAQEAAAVSPLSPAERDALTVGLRKIIIHLESMTVAPPTGLPGPAGRG
jgi:DNA-binding MarR family transcriptional regulator